MSKTWVSVGMRVKVYFENVQYLEGKLLAINQEEGQAYPEYSILDDDDKISTVQHFSRMSEV